MYDSKKNIAVFFGGCSSEYEVSLQSAYSVITNIDTSIYTPICIGIHRHTGKWYWYKGNVQLIREDLWFSEDSCLPVFPSTDKSVHGFHYMDENIGQIISIDAALPILHGKNGEDGTIQGILKLAGIPIIGCGILSSALCMDKDLAHRIVAAAGIRTPISLLLKKPYDSVVVKSNVDALGYPVFVKPVRAGSSIGITKVTSESGLLPAIEHAFTHDSSVILEEMIDGFEVGCAVLGTEDLMLGEIDEIELSEGFFDYTEKYSLKTSDIHVPARITPEKAAEIKQTALTIYRALRCSHFARVDMFLTPEGEIYFNEVNTIPGFTSHSRYPNMLKAAGLSFSQLINRLIKLEV